MTNTFSPGSLRNAFAVACTSLALGGCLMDDGDPKNLEDVATDNRLSGSVGDGPVVGAQMRILRNDGEELTTLESDNNASYNITVNTQERYYPLTIESTGGTDLVTNLVPDFDLAGAVFSPRNQSVANVNPHATMAVRLAGELSGGVTPANLESAQAIVTVQLNAGLDTLATSGVMTTHVDESNVAEMVRASETLAETIRRTRDLLNGAGFATDADTVVAVLSSDLTDQLIDGQGGNSANARTAAVATIVYAQVLLESMANELHVNGVNATAAMAGAISQVSVRTPTTTLDQLLVTSDMVIKARIGIAAALEIDNSPAVSDLHGTVSGLQAGMDASLVRSLFPADYRSILATALNAVAGADEGTINDINSAARGSGDIDPGNQAPTIMGTPAASVEVGNTYTFTPNANDPDGDDLTFTISNLPSWASFTPATGQLSGTPTTNDIGDYSNIVISVSDGEFTDSIAPFAINVFQGNGAPSISGTPATTVISGQSYVFQPTASDPNGDSVTFSISNPPAWASFNPMTGRLSGAPFDNDVGTYADIVISVSDGLLTSSLPPFTIDVVLANMAPTISGSPATTATEGQNYSFTPTASDPNGDTLSFSVVNRPQWASFEESTGTLSGTPGANDIGDYTGIVISVTDGAFTVSLPAFAVSVAAATNSPPAISGDAPQSVNANSSYSFTPTASDPDGDNLSFSVTNLPSWANFNTSNGMLSGTPGDADVGTYAGIRITVSDGIATASIEITITVNAVSLGSVVLSWTAPTQNVDGTTLTNLAGFKIYSGTTSGSYSLLTTINNPSVLTYQVDNLAPGNYYFVATAFNTQGVESRYSSELQKTVP